ncbi:MAG TPA: response regulator [Candidatus Nitrosotenuis sp.]|nr:response regulator [Candidatus Nitrosotenuis sp.]
MRVLLVEDSPADAALIQEILEEAARPPITLVHVERLSQALARLEERFDVVLLDLSLPDSQGLETFERVRTSGVPVVVLSGLDDEDTALAAVARGAQDYLVKGRADGPSLVRALRYARERHRLLQELEQARLRAQEASLAKSRFLSFLNHELRTPLNAVVGFSELLAGEEPLSPESVRQYAGFIHTAGLHLLQLVDDLLDFGLVETGRLELQVERFDLREVLVGAVSLVGLAARRKGLRLSLPQGPLGTVRADRRRLRQILFNLLSNAVKFTPEGGEVRLEVVREGDTLALIVSDTGVGIAPADQERIFEPFQRAAASASPAEGVGLGLAITRHLVEAHGGSISLWSAPGQGSRFTVVLPRAFGEAPLPSRTGEGEEILVVEDDPAAARLLSIYLREAGYSPRLASDGEAALAALARGLPRAVLLDLRLPGMDGWEVLRRLKAEPATRHLPVVVVSVLQDSGVGLALGAADYLVKPVERSALIQCLQRLVAGQAPEQVRVLAVDDDPAALALYASVLESEGMRVLLADGGQRGLHLAQCERPDVILLDLIMPDMDGFQVVSSLRSQEATRDIPVVVVTGHELTRQDKERLQGDIAGLLSKGASVPHELARWLQRAGVGRSA